MKTCDEQLANKQKPKEDKKDNQVLEHVKCHKCNRMMPEKTLKYSHQDKCPANKEKMTKKTKANKEMTIEPTTKQTYMTQSTISIRHERINKKKESYKQLITNAF